MALCLDLVLCFHQLDRQSDQIVGALRELDVGKHNLEKCVRLVREASNWEHLEHQLEALVTVEDPSRVC